MLPPLSVYLHLPWCERKCPYCDFNSHVRDDLPEEAYVGALLTDLAQELRGEERPLQTVFIGGGTPSLFSVSAISELLQGLRALADLDADAEITMEANPGSIESDRLAGYAAAGVNRFSVGVQSFDDDCLQALGRVHGSAEARAAARAAQHSGARSFNLDIMHGLPRQDLDSGLADLRTAVATGAPHLSWYQLTIEANTQFYRSPPVLPEEMILGSLEEQGSALLAEAGFRRYEVSAWARPGEECRHNLNYWRFGDYIGAGAGAHGKVSTLDGRILRYSKTRQPEHYLAERGQRRVGQRELGREDRTGEFMLGALRLTDGFSPTLYETRTGLDWDALRPAITDLQKQGLLSADEEQVAASALGRRFLDDVVGRFFPG